MEKNSFDFFNQCKDKSTKYILPSNHKCKYILIVLRGGRFETNGYENVQD